jgi:peptide/nickel transport system substrate-binding protein
MLSKKFYLIFALVLIAGLLLAACGGSAAPDTAATEAPAAAAAEQSAAAPAGSPDAVLTLGEQTMPTFTRNFNPLTPNSPLPGSINLIHEPLMIYNTVTGELVPWLATEYSWSDDLKTLTFTIRDGVQWSDGEPFTASDVAFTFNLLKTAPGVSSTALSALVGDSAYVDTITAPDDQTVQFTFKTVYTPGLYELIGQNIVPEHIWQDVTDVVAFTNENPVGTGPFTQVVNFTPQAYQIDKNPHYWQEGKPAFQSVVYKAFADANAASLAMVDGEIDWSNYRLTDPQNEFVSKDPANRYFINSEGPNMAILAMNIGREPFDDVNVRKAISMAINREQVAMIGEGGVVQPADVTGLTSLYTPWKVDDAAALGDWATYNVDKANELLDAAGLTRGADGIRVLPDGTPMRYSVAVLPAPNWLADLQVAAENLKEVGIELTVQPQPNYPEWVAAQQSGNFDMMFSIIDGNATPYRFYRMTMSSDLLQPEGTAAQGNYTRYAGGAADDLLQQFATATDPEQQKQIAAELQQVFAEEVPAVPFVPLGGMGLINTSRFTGFPTADNYYASAEPNPTFFADWLLVLTQLQPK